MVGFGWIDGWFAQNLSYHLPARPKWVSQLESEPNIGTVWIKGFNKINECNGVLYQIENFKDHQNHSYYNKHNHYNTIQ